MTDNFTNNPAAYLSELQRIERKQERAKLRTLSLEFAGVLDFFPKLREELKAFGNTDGIAVYDLADRLRSTLQQAVDLQFDMEDLPADLRNAPEMQIFVQRVKQTMSLQFVGRFTAQFNDICQGIQTRFVQEQAIAAQRTKDKAEAERKAREKIEAERKARERAEKERREREAKIQTAIPEMVVIPAGTFTMGCVDVWFSGRDNVDGGCSSNEKPAHPVSVARFLMGKYPVTFVQFDAFCEVTGFTKPSTRDVGGVRDNRPIVNVSWNDAQEYVRWLAEVTGKYYRLPSEAEWEYAARGGNDTTAYPWGRFADPKYANYTISHGIRKVGKMTPVGQYLANGFGLHDMHGNVAEWCQDAWHGDYQGAPSTGIAWDGRVGRGDNRVLRGGSWVTLGRDCRSAARGYTSQYNRYCFIGFRLALS